MSQEFEKIVLEKLNTIDKKLDISLKAYEQLNGKVKTNEFMISNLKSKDFQNDIRISTLEDKIKQLSMTA